MHKLMVIKGKITSYILKQRISENKQKENAFLKYFYSKKHQGTIHSNSKYAQTTLTRITMPQTILAIYSHEYLKNFPNPRSGTNPS